MTERLAQIDEIRKRLPVSYGEANEALEEADGDIVRALAILEARQTQGLTDLLRKAAEASQTGQPLRWRLEVGGVALWEQAVPAGQAPRWLRWLLLLLSLSKVIVEEEPTVAGGEQRQGAEAE